MVYAYRYECPLCTEEKTIFTDIKDFTAPLTVKCDKPDCNGVCVPTDWAANALDVQVKGGIHDAT